MNRKLTAKAQQIKPNIPASVKSFSDILVIEPDNQNLMLKKGTIYTVFDVTAQTELNAAVISKLIYDTIHDSYYQSENISPIQSLEKAISGVKERVTKMAATEFNILTGVLWGNVMYVVQYGKAESYLMRTGETRHINANSEGNFSAASGVIKDDDVIVFCTHEFSTQYPTEKLLSASVQPESLPLEASCLILKFVVDTSFTETENIDFGIKPVKKTGQPNFLTKLFKKPENRENKTESIIAAPVKLKTLPRIKITPVIIIIATAVLLIISVGFTIARKNSKDAQPETQVANKETTETPGETVETEAQPGFDEATKTQLIAPGVLYDIRIADTEANPTDLVIVQSTLVAADKASGKIYSSPAATPKFTQLTGTFPQIANLNIIDNEFNFTDAEGYKTYDLTDQKVTSTYTQPNLRVTNAYLEFVYALAGDSIIKYTKETGKFVPSTWAQNADFTDAKSLSIAVSIFVLKSDGTLISYTRGVKDSFSITGLAQPFNNPKQVVTNIDWDNLYVADSGNKRVVVLKKDGTFVKQFKTTKDDAWGDIRAITVTADEKTLYVLNGSKVFEVPL